jgi:vancomycin resistance protein YoaR
VLYGQQPAPVWLQLKISGSNLLFNISTDGVNFVTAWKETKTTFFTTAPDQFGYFSSGDNTDAGQGSNTYVTLLSWLLA